MRVKAGPSGPGKSDEKAAAYDLARCCQRCRWARRTAAPNLDQLKTMTARFAPVDLSADVSNLPANERQALAQARRSGEGDGCAVPAPGLGRQRDDAARSAAGHLGARPRAAALLSAQQGPVVAPRSQRAVHSRRAGEAGAGELLSGGRDEGGGRGSGSRRCPARSATFATGFFTTIRRNADGKFIAVPYSFEYQGELAHAAELLREAAALTDAADAEGVPREARAGVPHNDYYDSDVAWMELDASIEPTIGPYEVYEDEWFNYKAAFEAFITVRDDAETNKLARFGAELQEIENNLPIDPRYRNPKLGALAPIRVVNVVFSAGDANRGVQTAAFNLPNDERIIAEKGAKRVMLKNNQEAKFDKVLVPISKMALAAERPGERRRSTRSSRTS